jgi:hypothetical protein
MIKILSRSWTMRISRASKRFNAKGFKTVTLDMTYRGV